MVKHIRTKTEQADRLALEATTPLGNKQGHWWNDRGLRTLNFLLFIPLMSEYVQGYDSSLINNVQQLTSWQNDFHHPGSSLLGAMSASYWIGNVVGVLFIVFLADDWGRRAAMFIGSFICIVGTALATASINAGMFIAGRLLLGIGGVIVGAIGPVLMAELAYPSQRSTATALSNTQYSTGAIISAWITFGSFHMASSWAWRLPSIFQALPSVFQAIGIYFLPESPRWLISKGRKEKAAQILAKYHGNGDLEDEVVQFELAEIEQTIELEVAARQTKWSTLWSTPGNRWRSFVMIFCGILKQWSGNGLVSYYLHSMLNAVDITTQLDQTLITATSQMFSFACSMAFAFLPARYGRRPLFLCSIGGMWVVFTILTVTTGLFNEHKGSKTVSSNATVAFIYLYSGVHNLGITGCLMLYVVEILPYALRAKGIALFWLVTGVAGAFNTYVNPLGIAAFGWKFYWFYVVWIAIEFAVVYFTFIETKGPSLEEVALLIDGKNAKVASLNPVAEKITEGKGAEIEVSQVEKVEAEKTA